MAEMAPKINVFHICKLILESFQLSDERKKKIRWTRKSMVGAYKKGGTGTPINYNEEIVQFCYVQWYMPLRVEVMEFLVGSEIPRKNNRVTLFSNRETDSPSLRVLSIGCGPGSEMVGILKYCTKNRLRTDIHFDLFDKIDWADTIGKVANVLRNNLQPKPSFTYKFEKDLDFTADISRNKTLLTCAEEANMIIFSWSISDFQRQISKATSAAKTKANKTVVGNVKQLFDKTKDRTYFVIVESYRPTIFQNLEKADFVVNKSDTICNLKEEDLISLGFPRNAEEYKGEPENALGEYLDKDDPPRMEGVIIPLVFVRRLPPV